MQVIPAVLIVACLASASLLLPMLLPLEGNAVTVKFTNSSNTTGSGESPYQGVNMEGYYTTMSEARNFENQQPANYYDDSFRIFSEAGLNIVRYLFTWEAYEKNPDLFIDELSNVSKSADKWGLNVVYANDQYHISSWLDPKSGYGFPSFLFTSNQDRFPFNGGGSSDTEIARSWWSSWYDNTITDVGGHNGWTLQANFLKRLVIAVNKHTSTLGYEILNEPQVYSEAQWTKIGNYNTFMASELRQLTNKTIVFDRQLPSDIGGVIGALPENMAMMAPRNMSNIVFKSTLYGLPSHCSYAEARLSTAVRAAQLMKVPLWMGEFNIGVTPEKPIADINQTDIDLFINKFHEVDAWGWSLWLWSFRHHLGNVKNYDLAAYMRDNKSKMESIQPTKYFSYLEKDALLNSVLVSGSQHEDNSKEKKIPNGAFTFNKIRDTICPTISVTHIDGTPSNTNFFSSTSPAKRLQITVMRLPVNLLITGETYDVGSGINSVQIKVGESDQKYKPVAISSPKGSSQWCSSIEINETGINKLIIRAVDGAGNVGYNTIFLNITRDMKF
jgi:hypothetical protein